MSCFVRVAHSYTPSYHQGRTHTPKLPKLRRKHAAFGFGDSGGWVGVGAEGREAAGVGDFGGAEKLGVFGAAFGELGGDG